MPKPLLLTVFLLLSIVVHAQPKDTRGTLDLWFDEVQCISVSPSGAFWMITAGGDVYHTDNFDGNWEKHPLFPIDKNKYARNGRICFFNKDTALLIGNITEDSTHKESYIYRTIDGGKTWQKTNAGDAFHSLNITVLPSGHAWVQGYIDHSVKKKKYFNKEYFYYTNNYGASWKRLKKEVHLLYLNGVSMLDTMNGLAFSMYGKLLQTKDNWKTAKETETPYTQGCYSFPENSPPDFVSHKNEIKKVQYWGNYIVIIQHGDVYYTHKDDIKWKKLFAKLVDFEVSEDRQVLYGVTTQNRVVKFTSPTEYKLAQKENLEYLPKEIKIVGNDIYYFISTNWLNKINEQGISPCRFFTNEEKINPNPYFTPVFTTKNNLAWFADGYSVYLSEDAGKTWHREYTPGFEIMNFYIKGDSTAILTDKNDASYKYNLQSRKLEPIVINYSFTNFINKGVKSITIVSGYSGKKAELNHKPDTIVYGETSTGSSSFEVKKLKYYDSASTFVNQFHADTLVKILTEINNNPLDKPLLKDYGITAADIEKYRGLKKEEDFYSSYTLKEYQLPDSLYPNITPILDSLADFAPPFGIRTSDSPDENWYITILIINEGDDTLKIYNNPYISQGPFVVPYAIHIGKGRSFSSYNLHFQRFILSLLPDDFYGKSSPRNAHLILKIAKDIYSQDGLGE